MLRIKRLFHSLPIAHGVQVSPQNDDHIRMRSLEINKKCIKFTIQYNYCIPVSSQMNKSKSNGGFRIVSRIWKVLKVG